MEIANVIMTVGGKRINVAKLTIFPEQNLLLNPEGGADENPEDGSTICSLRFEINRDLRKGVDDWLTLQAVYNALDETFHSPGDDLFPFHELGGVRTFGDRPVEITTTAAGPIRNPGNLVRYWAEEIARVAEEWRRMLCPREERGGS